MKYFQGYWGKFLYFFKITQCFSMKFCTYLLAIALTVEKQKKVYRILCSSRIYFEVFGLVLGIFLYFLKHSKFMP